MMTEQELVIVGKLRRSCPRLRSSFASRRSSFSILVIYLGKYDAVIVVRPVVNFLFKMESRRCQLFDGNVFGNAMAATIPGYSFDGCKIWVRGKINDRELSPDLQGTYQVLIKAARISKVMIDAPQKNCVAAT